DDPEGDHVDVLAGGRVEAFTGGQAPDLLRDDAAVEAGVDRDLLQRGLGGHAQDVRAGRLVTLELQALEGGLGRLQEGHATTGDDALLDGGLGVAHRVLDAVLALLQLHLGGGTSADDRDAAGELGEALLELLPVVVRVAVLDLGLDLGDAAGDLLLVASAVDDGRLVLGDHDLAGAAEQVELGGLEGEADLLGDDLAPREDRD